MLVLKFGGTSVGTAKRMHQVKNIVLRDKKTKMVVLSALAGTTNQLVELTANLDKSQVVNQILDAFHKRYDAFIEELFEHENYRSEARSFLNGKFDLLRSFQTSQPSSDIEKIVLAQGELISTQLFSWLLESLDVPVALLPALEFMRIDKMGEPDEFYIKSMLEKELQGSGSPQIYVTQGYICRNAFGEVDNLKRGGSDYTATLLGQALNAGEIQIWTDIDGMHNNDPLCFQIAGQFLPAWIA